jgi:hypothetical protein
MSSFCLGNSVVKITILAASIEIAKKFEDKLSIKDA